jgi:hypothetical protein
MEEASFLRMALDKRAFYDEMRLFVDSFVGRRGLTVDPLELDAVFAYQNAAIVHYDDVGDKTLELAFDFPEYLFACAIEPASARLHRGVFSYVLHNRLNLDGNKRRFAEEVLWGGRKGGRFMYVAERASLPQ